jgi:hypothetical protein
MFCNGALAQLGERLHGMQEVSGSIPLGSTRTNRFRCDERYAGRRGFVRRRFLLIFSFCALIDEVSSIGVFCVMVSKGLLNV